MFTDMPGTTVSWRSAGATDELIYDFGCDPEKWSTMRDDLKAASQPAWHCHDRADLGGNNQDPLTDRTRRKLAKESKLVAIAGGGDTVSAMNHAGVANDLTFVSIAGGAFVDWMEGKPLPGVEAPNVPLPSPPGFAIGFAHH
jgi:phosphoglycerate kinase